MWDSRQNKLIVLKLNKDTLLGTRLWPPELKQRNSLHATFKNLVLMAFSNYFVRHKNYLVIPSLNIQALSFTLPPCPHKTALSLLSHTSEDHSSHHSRRDRHA